MVGHPRLTAIFFTISRISRPIDNFSLDPAMPTNAIDLLLRGHQATIPELVELLRNIHRGPKALVEAARAEPPNRLVDSQYDLASLIQSLFLDGLTRSNQDLARQLATNPEAGSGSAGARRYEVMRDRFQRLERDLQHHAAVVEHMLNRGPTGQSAVSGAAAYQETLYLQCLQAGRTAGRFRCVNRRSRPTSVTTSVREFSIRSASGIAAPTVTVRPSSFLINSECSEIISVEVDLAACPELVNEDLRGSIDLIMNDEIALKIWMEMHVYELR
jgi:hypothetical protein